MTRKALTLAVAIALVAVVAYRPLVDALRDEPAVSPEMLSTPWQTVKLANASLQLDLPFEVTRQDPEMPPEVRANTEAASRYVSNGAGPTFELSHIRGTSAIESTLDAAADGAIAGVRGVPGTVSANVERRGRLVSGVPALGLDGRIERERGDPLAYHGLVVIRDRDIWILSCGYGLNQSAGKDACERIRESIELLP